MLFPTVVFGCGWAATAAVKLKQVASTILGHSFYGRRF